MLKIMHKNVLMKTFGVISVMNNNIDIRNIYISGWFAASSQNHAVMDGCREGVGFWGERVSIVTYYTFFLIRNLDQHLVLKVS